jgi:dipeptidyl aminopeptidase/acylaminoacyl peptidase
MTFADLQAMKRISDPQVSPSGKWVLFSVTDVSLEKNTKTNHLWIVPLDGSGKEHQLTTGDGESNGRFSPDGKSVMYSSDDQISIAPWDDVAGMLGAPHAITTLSTGADGAIWSPDSKSILFTSEVYSDCSGWTLDDSCNRKTLEEDAKSPTKALVFNSLLYRHWNQYQAPLAKPDAKHMPGKVEGFPAEIARLSHILMVHLDHPEIIFDLTPPFDWGNDVIAPTFSLGGPLGYTWSPDSKEIAFVVNADKVPAESTNNDIYVIDATLHDQPVGPSHKVTFAQGNGVGSQEGQHQPWLR